MTISMYDLTVVPLRRGFAVLSDYIDKAEAHARARGLAADALMHARVAPDLRSFAGQIQRASDSAKDGVARLAGLVAPCFADDEGTPAALRQRIAKTVAWIDAVGPEQWRDNATRAAALNFGRASDTCRGDEYVIQILVPNFYFVAVAHGILRQQGVQLDQIDYLGYGE